MENPQQEVIGHLQGRLRKAFARLDFEILLSTIHNHSVVVGFSFKNNGGSEIMWGFGKSVGCGFFGWGWVGEWKLSWGIFQWGLLEGAGRNKYEWMYD